MKQVLQNMQSGKTSVIDVPVPQARPKTALIKTAASLVSAGTERMLVDFASKNLIRKAQSRPDLVRQVMDKAKREGIIPTIGATLNRLDQPLTLGYSSAGTIVASGTGLKGFRVGERVACAGAGYAVHAEYAVVPQNLLAKLPDNVDFESGAFATLGSIAMNGFRLANIQVGDNVAIIGLGLLGLITARISQAAGCSIFGLDIDPRRIQMAKKQGIDCCLNKDAEKSGLSFTNNVGFDAILICADTPKDDTVELAAKIARDRAHVISIGAVGLNLQRKSYYDKELFFQVSRSYGPGRYDKNYEENACDYPIGHVRWTEGRNMQAFVNLISHGKIEVNSLITHHFPIEKATQAYQLITNRVNQDFLGVMLTYPEKTLELEFIRIPVYSSFSSSKQTSEKLNLGVLGAGNYANAVFLPAIKSVGDVGLHTIVSAGGNSAQHTARKFKFAYAASDENAILSEKKINMVAILTRHCDHANQTIENLKLGKHVYCEKPLALKEEELVLIERELKKKNHPYLMVGFNRRFSPFGLSLKNAFMDRTEPLYAHYRINAGYLPASHWLHDPLIGGGRILGEGCHFIDFLIYLVGLPPSSIFARAMPDYGKYNQDNTLLTLEFPDGSMGSIAYLANGDKSYSKEYIEVFCGGKIGILDDFSSLSIIQGGHRQQQKSHFGQDKGHRAAWQAFLDSIKNGSPAPIPYQDVLATAYASIAAIRSLNLGIKIYLGKC